MLKQIILGLVVADHVSAEQTLDEIGQFVEDVVGGVVYVEDGFGRIMPDLSTIDAFTDEVEPAKARLVIKAVVES